MRTDNDRYLDLADRCFSPWIEALKTPAYSWPQTVRRAYVLTWPFSALARGIAIAVLILTWLIVGCVGFVANRLSCIWRGEESIWGD